MTKTKPVLEWTLEDYTQHYVDTIFSTPDGLGAYKSRKFGQSYNIMIQAMKLFDKDEVAKVFKEYVLSRDKQKD